MSALKYPEGLKVDLGDYEVVVEATFGANDVTLKRLFVGCPDTAITVAAVIALDDEGVNIESRGFDEGVE